MLYLVLFSRYVQHHESCHGWCIFSHWYLKIPQQPSICLLITIISKGGLTFHSENTMCYPFISWKRFCCMSLLRETPPLLSCDDINLSHYYDVLSHVSCVSHAMITAWPWGNRRKKDCRNRGQLRLSFFFLNIFCRFENIYFFWVVINSFGKMEYNVLMVNV